MLILGVLIILSAFTLLIISVFLEILTNIIKNKNKTLIPTDIAGKHRIKYNIPSKFTKVIKLNQTLVENRILIKLSLLVGAMFSSVPLMQLLISYLPLPK
ncbi:hypothetical protein [Staphylococcus aureus]|uniref:hypothetical protein n=1 Tax=Staphylococcus aureus TaxID=1280 RepID=UPI001153EC2C|nr:hypothetical protein [Staphylococcus aureus]